MISVIILILEIVLLFALQELGITSRPDAFVLVLIILFSAAYLYDIQKDEGLRLVQLPLALGYLLRIFLIVFDIYGRNIYVLPNSGADTEMFYNGALTVAEGGVSVRGFFVYFIAFLFKNIGVSRIYTQFLLMLCSMAAIHMAEKTMRMCDVDEDTCYSVLMILCLLPNFAIMSSILLRESIVTMFVALSVYFFVCLIQKEAEGYFLLSIACAFFAMRFHSGTVAVLVGAILARAVYNKKAKTVSVSVIGIVSAFIILLISVYLLNHYNNLFLGKMLGVDSLEDLANTNTSGGSSYAKYVGNSNNLFNMLIFTIPRIVFFLFSPMPFQWRGLSDIIAFFFSSLFYIVVIWKTITYLINEEGEKKTIVWLLLIIAVASMFVFAWGVSNAGTAVRHRDKMIILYAVLYALVKSDERQNNIVESNYLEPKGQRYVY